MQLADCENIAATRLAGLVFNLSWGKTLRNGSVDTFGLGTFTANEWVCPVKLVDGMCKETGL
jgi:hypothetical protein